MCTLNRFLDQELQILCICIRASTYTYLHVHVDTTTHIRTHMITYKHDISKCMYMHMYMWTVRGRNADKQRGKKRPKPCETLKKFQRLAVDSRGLFPKDLLQFLSPVAEA